MAKKLTVKEAKLVKVSDLKNWANNPRFIKDDRYKELIESIKELGFNDVLKLAADGKTVIGGNMRLKALQELGVEQVQAIITDATTPEQIFKIAIRDNEAFGEYNREQLVELAYSLDIPSVELDTFMVHLEKPQSISDIIKEDTTEEIVEDEAPEVSSEPPISELGKIYQLGRHRVMCGDSTDARQVSELIDDTKADMVFTDPPYGVDYKGINNDSRAGLEELIDAALGNMSNACKDGASVYMFHSDKCADIFHNVFRTWCHFSSMIIWVKPSLVLSQSDYHSRHEPCLYGWFNTGKHTWYSDRKQDSVWEMGKESVDGHTTPKPIEVVSKAINNSSEREGIVLDLFLGSGSTLIACEQTDRTCYGMELDPKYVDVIRKRYAKFISPSDWEETWESLTPAKN